MVCLYFRESDLINDRCRRSLIIRVFVWCLLVVFRANLDQIRRCLFSPLLVHSYIDHIVLHLMKELDCVSVRIACILPESDITVQIHQLLDINFKFSEKSLLYIPHHPSLGFIAGAQKCIGLPIYSFGHCARIAQITDTSCLVGELRFKVVSVPIKFIKTSLAISDNLCSLASEHDVVVSPKIRVR